MQSTRDDNDDLPELEPAEPVAAPASGPADRKVGEVKADSKDGDCTPESLDSPSTIMAPNFINQLREYLDMGAYEIMADHIKHNQDDFFKWCARKASDYSDPAEFVLSKIGGIQAVFEDAKGKTEIRHSLQQIMVKLEKMRVQKSMSSAVKAAPGDAKFSQASRRKPNVFASLETLEEHLGLEPMVAKGDIPGDEVDDDGWEKVPPALLAPQRRFSM